jgi:endonuclease III
MILRRRWANSVDAVSAVLRQRYRNDAHNNKLNPLDELLFILCSVRTPESNYQSTYLALKREFPRFKQVAEAPADYIAKPLERGGLSNDKARAIRSIMYRLMIEFGRPTLAPLARWTDEECEGFLTSLPYVGQKVARCVMMYSLGRKVFPVDTHCWRICRRLGWIRPTMKDGHPSPRDMDRLQEKIPPELRFSLHVNMVSLGREICTANKPRCEICPIQAYCRKVGVKTGVRISKVTRPSGRGRAASEPLSERQLSKSTRIRTKVSAKTRLTKSV